MTCQLCLVCLESDERNSLNQYSDTIMSAMESQITGVSIVYSTVCSVPDQRKHQSSASLAFVRRIHWWPVNSPHKGPVKWKMFPFEDGFILRISLTCLYWDVHSISSNINNRLPALSDGIFWHKKKHICVQLWYDCHWCRLCSLASHYLG